MARHPPGAAEGTARNTSFINGDILYLNYDCPFGGFGGSWRVKFYKGSVLSLVSGMILAGASIALIFSPIHNDLPCIELRINFAFKISRAVYH